jgi:hypothetical protein
LRTFNTTIVWSGVGNESLVLFSEECMNEAALIYAYILIKTPRSAKLTVAEPEEMNAKRAAGKSMR